MARPFEGKAVITRWAHPQRRGEVTDELVDRVTHAYRPDALDALDSLREPPAFIRAMDSNSMMIPVTIQELNNLRGCSVTGLVDSGATGGFINERLVEERGFEREPLPLPVPVYNADGTPNRGGEITHVVRMRLQVQDHTEVCALAVTDTGKSDVIIGFNWLRKHNPEIDWEKGELKFTRCPASCKRERLQDVWAEEDQEDIQEGDRIFITRIYPDTALPRRNAAQLRAMGSVATKLAAAANEAKGEQRIEDNVPEHYLRDYRSVFEKDQFDKLPARKKWDHAIELKPGAEPVKGRNIPLNPTEQRELDAFIKEHLETGRIRPSKSPWALPFFFVKKKDGKLRPVQDYRKLNELTIKNRYPIPLISEIMHMLRKATWFTKLDV